jgi:hypothetical protein
LFLLSYAICVDLDVITFLLPTIRLYGSRRATTPLYKRLNRGFADETQLVVLFSGQSVLTLRIKSPVTNSNRDLQGRTVEA